MTGLANQSCEACSPSAPRVDLEKEPTLLSQIPDWKIAEDEGIHRLVRAYRFKNFGEALAFTNAVGEIAESENHHPDLLTEWGRVTVTWWSHKIKGLHVNDFVMAAKTDTIYSSAGG